MLYPAELRDQKVGGRIRTATSAPKAGAMTGLRYTLKTSNKRRNSCGETETRTREHLRVHRLAICCIATLPPLHSYNQTGVQM